VQHYVRRFSRELGREVRQVAPEVLACLRAYSWPGNVRELQSVLKQALLKGSGSVLLPAFLPDFHEGPGILDERREECQADLLPTPRPSPLLDSPPITDDVRDLYADAHRQTDQLLLPRVLEYTRGNLQQAALLLGIARQTLRLKLRDLGLSLTRAIEREDGLPAKHEQK
jgi:two-component system nitrogen regulation response regulator GlnG